MRRWSLLVFPGALVCGVVAALSGRWLVALLSYVLAVASTLHIVADLDPEAEHSPAAITVVQDVIVVPKPRTKVVRLASAGLAMKAGLVLGLPAAAGAATGSLPHTVQDWVADAVQRAVGLDIPGGTPADERRGTDPRLVKSVPEDGPAGPAPAPDPGAPGGPSTETSRGDGDTPSADQPRPPDATSTNGPSKGEERPSPPSPEQRPPDGKMEVPTTPVPLPVSPVLPPPVAPGVPEVGNEGGLGIGDQRLP